MESTLGRAVLWLALLALISYFVLPLLLTWYWSKEADDVLRGPRPASQTQAPESVPVYRGGGGVIQRDRNGNIRQRVEGDE